ncbi:MAG TPA: BMP family ABC transporter substrate-binding protein [Acidimicrobiales bacterium]|nr:BMP family ABC transporter substrate-binding protein [Acidimicrobiales bacterium]
MSAAGAAGVFFGGTILGACGSDSDSGGGTTAGTTGDTASGDTTATTGAAGAGGAALDKLRLGFAYIGPINDNGWTQEHHRGRQAVFDKFGDTVEGQYVENVMFDPAQTTPILEDLAQNHDLVIANTEYSTLLSDVAAKNPDTKFRECNGHVYTDNLGSYYLAHHQPTYAMGVAAALLNEGQDVKIGYIGAFPTATAYNDVNGLVLGARTINPNATVKAVMISSFFDPPKATAAANALLAEDINFIFAVMDEPSFLQVANDAGVWAGAWNTDVRQFGPEVYVNTLQLDFGPYYIEQAQAMFDGTWAPGTEPDLLALDLGTWGDNVPADVSAEVDKLRPQLLDGSLNPYTGPILDSNGTERVKEGESLDNQQAYLIDWAAEGVSGVEG